MNEKLESHIVELGGKNGGLMYCRENLPEGELLRTNTTKSLLI